LYVAHWENPHLKFHPGELAGGNGVGGGVAESEDGVDRNWKQAAMEDQGEGGGKWQEEDEWEVAACAWPVISLDVLWHDPH
jgi:hypothetical protein